MICLLISEMVIIMRTKERELLERVMYRIPSAVISEHDLDLVDEIKELLAQPERKSFSDEEITKAFTKSVFGTWDSKSYRSGFKDAEKAHGIGGGDEY